MTPHTLYRLNGVDPTPEGMLDALDARHLDELGLSPHVPDNHLGCPSLLISGQFDIPRVAWCREVSSLTGVELNLSKIDTAALLMVAVDDTVYAVGFGQGHRLVPKEIKDADFGLRIAVRTVDPDRLNGIVRRSMTGRGRQDSTRSPSGIALSRVGIQHDELVRALEGRIPAAELGLPGVREISIAGTAAGLRLSLPSDPQAFIECIRALARIHATEPRPDLAFVEAVRPVSSKPLIDRLDRELDARLVDPSDDSLDIAVPVELLDHLPEASAYTTRIGSVPTEPRRHLHLSDVRVRVGVQHAVTPTAALRAGRISMLGSGGEKLAGAPAIDWIEAHVNEGFRHYFLMEGVWHEVGADYLASIDRQVRQLMPTVPSITMPAWREGEWERDYNIRAQDELKRANFLCLDRKTVRTALHKHPGFEVCDGYGPNGELICVKPADGSAPLSHQFNQGLVAVETLLHDATAREGFNALVTEASGGTRHVPPDARPSKVIFAIHLKNGRTLTPHSLFPFARVALVNMAASLSRHVEVEVIGIPRAPLPAAPATTPPNQPSLLC